MMNENKRKMTRLSNALLIGVIFNVLVATAALAGPVLDQIQHSGVFRFGTEGTYAPFTFHDSTGALVGFDVDLARAISARMGVKAEFMEGKSDGLIAGLDNGRYEAIVNQVSITEPRKAKYDFSQPYISSTAVLIVRKDDNKIKGFADLKGRKVAEALSSNFGVMAEKANADIVRSDGFDQSIQLVLTGRADATINDSLSFYDFKKKKPDAKVKIVAEKNDASNAGVMLRKGDAKLIAAIDKALDKIKADGTYKKIYDTYFAR